MSDATFESARALIESQIQTFLPQIGRKSEITDKYLKAKVIGLIEALEGISEYGDDLAAYSKDIHRKYRAHHGAAESLHDLLVHLGVRHRHAGKSYPG